jgi:hypothetical protein
MFVLADNVVTGNCPFHTLQAWQEMRIQQPSLFWRACELEALLNERRQKLGRDRIWLTAANRPLATATTDHVQGKLTQEVEQMCGGYCHL